MLDISKNGIITLSRGDTFTIDVDVNIGTSLEPLLYTLKAGDVLYFALMEPNQPFECAIMRRAFTNADLNEDDSVHMTFSSEMTEFLMPGNYYYMVKLYRPGEESGEESIDTIISKTKFFIID